MIVRNSAKCSTCDVELVSEHRHDLKVHSCPNNFKPALEWVMVDGKHSHLQERVPREPTWNWAVDGGRAYVRRLGSGFTDTSIYSNEELENEQSTD
jgi:hypothetical protein